MRLINKLIIFFSNLVDIIHIQHIDMFNNLLQNFGKLLSNMIIIFEGISEHDGKQMLKLINDECSKTLQQLELKACKGTMLDQLKKPFTKVSHLFDLS